MNSTVEKFNQKIEELKKRLKAISTSQNVLSKLNALEDYFKQIQDYLNSINTSFSDHITQSEDYSENIATLQSQIAEVQQQIQNLPDLEDLNLTQMQADISTLQNDLSTLKGSSNSSISNLESQIATIQADISTITAQIPTLQSNISKNSSDISTLKTTTQNHSTTLTNLTSSQNTLSSTVSNINNRLTSAESELSAITGGIDLTELDARVEELETLYPTLTLVDTETITINKTFTNVSNYTLKSIAFRASPQGTTYTRIKVTYDSQASLSHKFEFRQSAGASLVKTVSTNEYPNSYTAEIFSTCYDYINVFSTILSTSNTIKIKTITIDFFCKNSLSIEYDPEIYACCFNNEIYITKKTENSFKFGKFNSENLSITDFPYEMPFDFNNKINRLFYMPKTTGTNGTFESVDDCLITEETTGAYKRYINIDQSLQNLTQDGSRSADNTYRCFIPAFLNDTAQIFISGGLIKFMRPFVSVGTTSLSGSQGVAVDKWSLCVPVLNNYQTLGSAYYEYASVCAVALNCNGYFYFLNKNKKPIKIAKGEHATAYKQQDGTINVYIKSGNQVNQYVITIDENDNATVIYKTFIMALQVYELIDGIQIQRRSSDWVIVKN